MKDGTIIQQMDGMVDMQYKKTLAARAVEYLIWEIEGYGVGLWR